MTALGGGNKKCQNIFSLSRREKGRSGEDADDRKNNEDNNEVPKTIIIITVISIATRVSTQRDTISAIMNTLKLQK